MTNFIFITGGVCSSLGKGIAMSSLGALLQMRGFSIKLRKLEQYLNIDSGTMSPIKHGEVFVTNDGLETDLDLGHYERFTGIKTTKDDYITMGSVYSNVLKRERKGDYLGSDIQVIPHVTDTIKKFIKKDSNNVDFTLIEIGGTVGDIEGQAYIEAVRQLRYDLSYKNTLFIHLVLLPYISTSNELKTKPAQHSVKWLQSLGVQPDILLCRSDKKIPISSIKKLSLFCNVEQKNVIEALNAKNIYEVPLLYNKAGLDNAVCDFFEIKNKIDDKKLKNWHQITKNRKFNKKINVGIVGKYFELPDAYKSLIEAIQHAAIYVDANVNIIYINSEKLEEFELENLNAIIVPGGFGDRGYQGKINAIKFARENKIPFLGICLGMQLAIIEFARNVLNIKDATSSEFDPDKKDTIIGLVNEWVTNKGDLKKAGLDKGGTMRLGSYQSNIKKNTLAYEIYKKTKINERHRHRYEFNKIQYGDLLEKNGMQLTAFSYDQMLTEIIEIQSHPFFIAVQFHPEFNSSPFHPHPIFSALIEKACCP